MVKVVKKYKLPVIKHINPGDVMYILSVVTIVKNSVLHI